MIGMSSKSDINIRDYFPCHYWLRRYLHNGMGQFFFRIFLIDMGIMAGLLSSNIMDLGLEAGLMYFVSRILFYSAYEIGYVVNDYFDASEKGIRRIKIPYGDLAVFCFTRLCLLIVGAEMLSGGDSAIYGLLCLVLFGFYLHSTIRRSWRMPTYFLLQLIVFFWPLAFFYNYDAALVDWLHYALCVAPSVVALTVNYGAGKKLFGLAGVGKFRFRLMLIFGLVASLFCAFAFVLDHPAMPVLFWFAIGSMTVYLLILMSGFRRSVHRALSSKSLFHNHTYCSHDATSSISALLQFTSEIGFTALHVTDHAEDFHLAKYVRQHGVVTIAKKRNKEIKVVQGLEYDIHGEHFLCLGLRKFIPISGDDASDLKTLRAFCDEIIWAHPKPAFRRILLDPSFRSEVRLFLKYVDGVEIINFKSLPRKHFWWKHFVFGFVAYALGKSKFTVGADIHVSGHICRLGHMYPLGSIRLLEGKIGNARRLRNFLRYFIGIKTHV